MGVEGRRIELRLLAVGAKNFISLNKRKLMDLLAIAAILAAFWSVDATIYFKEEFSDGDAYASRWISSTAKGAEMGVFRLSSGKFYGDEEKDKGLQTSQDARFYGISTKFEPFSNEGKPLVIQFQVKHEQNIDCGGGYVKVFGADLDQTAMHGETPYHIMFGPDICGSTKRVHVIFTYKGTNHLVKKKNPEDWVDAEMIPDPEDVKPEDWDKPQHVPDSEASKPSDWDDDMDGEWEAPMVDNPEYKGEWRPKEIVNPDYKGPWVHPMIPNPEYVHDPFLYRYEDIAGLGFDLWQVKSGTIFDNIIVTDDPTEAEAFASETFEVTKVAEKAMKEAEEAAKKEEEADAKDDDGDDDDDDDEEEVKGEDDEEAAEDAEDTATTESHDEL